MKRILNSILLVASMSALLFSCSPAEKGDEQPEEVKMPVVGLKIPDSVEAGKSFELLGTGFPDDSKVSLAKKSDPKSLFRLTVRKIAAGLECSVYSNVAAGAYDIILASGKNEWVLTEHQSFEVTPALPVAGLKIPEKVIAGEELVLKGAGFPQDSRIFLKAVSGKAADGGIELKVELNSSGLLCRLAKDFTPGLYDVILVSGKYNWTLTGEKKLEVLEPLPPKQISSIQYEAPDAGFTLRNVKFDYSADGNLVKISDPEMVLDNYDRTFSISLSDSEFSGSNMAEMFNGDFQGFKFNLNKGLVEKCTFTIYKDKVSEVDSWEYDDKGFCTSLDKMMKNTLDFKDAKEENNPSGLDVAKLLSILISPAVQGKTNMAVLYAVALGFAGSNYPLLPSKINLPVQNAAGGFDYEPLNIRSYVKDADGYVTKITFDNDIEGLGKMDVVLTYK